MVQALDGDLALVGERSAKFANPPGNAGSRITIDEELWSAGACSQPLRILLDDRHHILGHALYRQLARPYEGRKPSIAVAIRSPVGFHLFLGQLAQHASRKCYFDKHVLVENESLSLRRAKRPKLSVAAICIVLPSARKNDRLKIGDGFDLVWIAPGAKEADMSPPTCPIRVTFFVSCSTSSHASM